jgi:hypothetical protein
MPTEDKTPAKETGDDSRSESLCAFDEVRQTELDEISRRRLEAGLPKDEKWSGDNLVGLALSGGGIRSAAFSLGVLHTVSRRGVMPFIDYLSTVSGGGYAGAFLSSYVLGARKNWRQVVDGLDREDGQQPAAPRREATRPASNDAARTASIADPSMPRAGRFPKRMLQFLFGGNYLRHTWIFFNRYLMGLLLIWIVTFSGLIAAASGIAYAARSLEYVQIRSWLGALDFDGDVRLAFFPTFVLLVIWLVAWGISYFRSLARAEGNAARHVFYLVVVTALVATASLISMRHIALTYGTDPQSQAAGSIGRTLGTVIISAIGASLIPYLRPKALLRSGTNPQNSAEKYTFWIASRALLYGVPFVVVAYFAQENLSDYNRTRDSTLTFSEIKNWDTSYAPLFLRIEDEWKQGPDESLRLLPGYSLHAHISPDEFHQLDRLLHEYYAWLLPDNPTNSVRAAKNELGAESAMMSLPKRWWHFAEHNLNVLASGAGSANPTIELVKARDAIINQQRAILARFNQALLDTHLYQRFDVDDSRMDADLKKAIIPILQEAREIDESQHDLAKRDAAIAATKNAPETEQPKNRRALASEEQRRAVLDVNRKLLTTYYPKTIHNKDDIFSSVVLEADQDVRAHWFLMSACIFLVLGAIVDLNATSWHAFYSRQMANMWIEPAGHGTDRRDIPLADLSTVLYGWPYHLISGSLQLFGRRRTSTTLADRQSFLFSRLYCGTDALNYVRTKDYMGGDYSLADAVAVSGAAVSPVQSRNPLVTALLFIFNIRLGQWVANPGYVSRLPKRLAEFVARLPFTPLRLLTEMSQNAEDRPHCFVTDGGHYENLAIEPLLKRRCRLIIASDAGQDGDYEFTDLMRLIRWARINEGIEVVPLQERETTLNLSGLIPNKETQFSAKHFLVARILYPPEETQPATTGYLVYLKSSLCKDDPCDLLQYRRVHTQFPHDDTSDQFYDPDRFFCYWQLGAHIAAQACVNLRDSFKDVALSTTVDDFIVEFIGHRPVGGDSGPDADKPGATAKPDVRPSGQGPGGSAEEVDERQSPIDRAIGELLQLLDPVNEASDRSTSSLIALAPDVFRYFGRNGIRELTPEVREVVLGPLLKQLFHPGARPGVAGRRALEKLTADLVGSTDLEHSPSSRVEAVDGLGGILQLANLHKYLRLARQNEDSLAHSHVFDPHPEVRRRARAYLKEHAPNRLAKIQEAENKADAPHADLGDSASLGREPEGA